MAIHGPAAASRHTTVFISIPSFSVEPDVTRRVRMKKLRVLIVDDEPLARARVRAFLAGNAAVEISGECANGHEAIEALRDDGAEIAFLDVQMPGCDGLQALEQLAPEDRPAIILTTAHERFALKAFEEQVVDYLLKPFDKERFQLALGRAIAHVRAKHASDLGERVETALAGEQSPASGRLAVKVDGRHVFLKPDDVAWVEAASNYATLHLVSGKRLLVRESLASLEKRLGTRKFARVNRSALVHVDQLQELQPAKYGDYVVVLANGTRLPLSRNLRGKLATIIADAP
jgi:two-component system, LytTR family, response regulator